MNDIKVTYTYTSWPKGKTGTWTTDRTQLDWLQLKQRMGMHPQLVILKIEEPS